MHISLDGFVAGPKGEMNWIKVDQEIFDHIGQRVNKCNTALYGRTTFQMMESYWPTAADSPTATKHDIEHAAWYKKVHKVVLSNSLNEADFTNTTVINKNIVESINDLKQKTEGDILIFGSPTATHTLMQKQLIDGYWLFVNPVILGQGIPLFKDIQNQLNLKLIATHPFSNGVTELDYVVEK